METRTEILAWLREQIDQWSRVHVSRSGNDGGAHHDGFMDALNWVADELDEAPAADLPTPAPGDIWRSRDGSEWRIVGPEVDGRWLLSGPLPCRGGRFTTTKDLLATGTLVSRTTEST